MHCRYPALYGRRLLVAYLGVAACVPAVLPLLEDLRADVDAAFGELCRGSGGGACAEGDFGEAHLDLFRGVPLAVSAGRDHCDTCGGPGLR
jgi:hypothetical protein